MKEIEVKYGSQYIKRVLTEEVSSLTDKDLLDTYDYYKVRNLGKEEKVYLAVLINEMKKRFGTCPICGGPINGYPAISRKDNKTEICSECGQREAMQSWIQNEMVKKLKNEYPAGTRIELIHMGEDIHRVEDNTKGTVEYVDDIGTIHCVFDNGRQLGLVPGEDNFRRIEDGE